MPKPPLPYPAFTYLSHQIHLTEDYFFIVSGPEFDSVDMFFESRRSAMQEIYSRVLSGAKSFLKNPHSKHHVLDPNGNAFYATRINPISGQIADCETFDFIYPNTEETRTLLLDRKALQTEIDLINQELSKIQIPVTRQRNPGFDLPWLTLKLETELREKLSFALKQGTQR